MSFPSVPYAAIGDYWRDYSAALSRAAQAVQPDGLARAQAILTDCIAGDGHVYACGNGGSAAISNHLVCDHMKGIASDTGLRPRVYSLSATVELITAIGNDLEYAEIFAQQIRTLGRAGDVLMAISSSGDSENIVRALNAARQMGMATIALTGFSGGRAASLADAHIHVPADNYGVVEDLHQSLMHVLAQFIRQAHMPADLISKRRF